MISEEQQKQTVLEEKSSIVNENTSGMAVDGHIGTWHTIDHKEIDGHTFWLMEHDTFGDDASCLSLIHISSRGALVIWWGLQTQAPMMSALPSGGTAIFPSSRRNGCLKSRRTSRSSSRCCVTLCAISV